MNFFGGCCSSKDGAEPAKKNTENAPENENEREVDGLAVEGKAIFEQKPDSPAKNSAAVSKLEEAPSDAVPNSAQIKSAKSAGLVEEKAGVDGYKSD